MKDKTHQGLKIAAVGDLDNDSHIDIVTLNNDLNAFTAHFQDEETKMYKPTSAFKVDVLSPDAKVASVIISRDKRELQ